MNLSEQWRLRRIWPYFQIVSWILLSLAASMRWYRKVLMFSNTLKHSILNSMTVDGKEVYIYLATRIAMKLSLSNMVLRPRYKKLSF